MRSHIYLSCPRCHFDEFSVELPNPNKEPHWYARCLGCEHLFELVSNGLVQEVTTGA